MIRNNAEWTEEDFEPKQESDNYEEELGDYELTQYDNNEEEQTDEEENE